MFFVSVFCQQEKSNATRKTKSTKAINIYLLAVLLHFQTEIVKSKKNNIREQEVSFLLLLSICFDKGSSEFRIVCLPWTEAAEDGRFG